VDFTDILKNAGVDIAIDGLGRWRGNIVVERLCRSLKHKAVYLNAYETGPKWRRNIGAWIDLYNRRRPHASLDDRTAMKHIGDCPAGVLLRGTLNPWLPPYRGRPAVRSMGVLL
jgi:putative transposase